MTYEQSFLSTCDAEGKAPAWAIKQIFNEHGSSLEDYSAYCFFLPAHLINDGEDILNYLGY